MNDTPLSCWVVVEKSREICCAHCNCMAGLGEMCIHIAAVLFYLEAVVRIQGQGHVLNRSVYGISHLT